MLASERIEEIEQLIFKNGKVLVKDLVKRYQVTPDLIRKDLQKLQKKGNIKKVRGGAILNKETSIPASFENRCQTSVSEKKDIASIAIQHIKEYDTVFIDNSSVGYYIAKYIIHHIDFPITIVTNMFETANILRGKQNIQLILIGGTYDPYLGCCMDYLSQQQIKQFVFDVAFVGAASIDFDNQSLTIFNIEEGHMKNAIIQQSKKTYVVMSSDHFSYEGRFLFSKISNIDAIITDKKIQNNVKKAIKDANVGLLF